MIKDLKVQSIVIVAALSLGLAGCSTSGEETSALASTPGAEVAEGNPTEVEVVDNTKNAEVFSLSTLLESPREDQAAACSSLLGSPEEAAALVGLSPEGLETVGDRDSSKPWSTALTTKNVSGQLDLACMIKFYSAPAQVSIFFGLPETAGVNIFCEDENYTCVKSDDGQRSISVKIPSDLTPNGPVDEEGLRHLLDRFTA